MPFELAEAYVQMSERGFKTVMETVDELQDQMTLLTQSAGKNTDRFADMSEESANAIKEFEKELGVTVELLDGPFTAAVKAVGNSILETVDSAKELTPAGNEAEQVIFRIESALARIESTEVSLKLDETSFEAVREELRQLKEHSADLDAIDLDMLKSVEESLPAMVEQAKAAQELRDALVEADEAQRRQLDPEDMKARTRAIEVAFNRAKNRAREESEEMASFIQNAVDEVDLDFDKRLDAAINEADELGEALDELNTERLQLDLKKTEAGIAAMVIALAGATKFVLDGLRHDYSATIREEAEKIAEIGRKRRQERIDQRLEGLGGQSAKEQLEFLRAVKEEQTEIHDQAKKTQDLAKDRAVNSRGFYTRGTPSDPSFNLLGSVDSFKDSAAAMEKIGNIESSVIRSHSAAYRLILRNLEIERLLLEGNAEAAERLKIARDHSILNPEDIEVIIKSRNANRELEQAKKVQQVYEQGREALKLRNIELSKGAEAAARHRDLMAGLSQAEADELAALRQRNDELAKAAIQEGRVKRIREESNRSLAEEIQHLRLRAIAAEQGEEAAMMARDILAGRTKEQREMLEMEREVTRIAEENAKSKRANAGFVGLTQVVEQMQRQALAMEEQRKQQALNQQQVDELQKLVRMANGEGIKIRSNSPKTAKPPNFKFGGNDG